MDEESHPLGLKGKTQLFLDSIVVSISACHVEGPGSIPGRGVLFLLLLPISCLLAPLQPLAAKYCRVIKKKEWLAPRGIEPVTFALLARRSNQLS